MALPWNHSKDVSYLLTNPKWSLTLVLETKTRLHLTIDIQTLQMVTTKFNQNS
jgi:hypothetical protein